LEVDERSGVGCTSLKQRTVQRISDEIDVSIQASQDFKLDLIKAIASNFSPWVNRIEIFHRVVVIDSMLWLSKGRRLISIPWCRFWAISPYGESKWWTDVVNANEFESYAKELNSHYEKFYRRIKARRWD
jgi:hypothetical protein